MITKEEWSFSKIGTTDLESIWCKIIDEYKYIATLVIQICFLIFDLALETCTSSNSW